MTLYSIKDTKAGTFGNLFPDVNKFTAMRQMTQFVNSGDDKNIIVKNPQDFELWSIGTFNQESGELESKTEFIINLAELKQQ